MEQRQTHHLVEAPDPERDLAALVALVDAYRAFYGRPAGDTAAFVRDRLRLGDTRFFVSRSGDGALAGFAHLVPTLDTLALRRIGVLEDLYVVEEQRHSGLGGALLDAAEAYAREQGLARLTLATTHRNYTAQRVYVAHGYVPDQRFRTFNLVLTEDGAR
jgi:GNAT superfamily N-acetyltransferase